jgi:AraC-like DNA-binding protein
MDDPASYAAPRTPESGASPGSDGHAGIAGSPCGQSRYGAIVRHIRSNLSRRITVKELAAIASLSVFQLSRAFRREHATTPYRLVLDLRIEHAKDRLSAGATILETALQAGFSDQSHFTRHFKRLTGMTPKRFSRAVADHAGRAAGGARRAARTGPRR